MDFLELTETDLKILFTNTCKLSQALCYLAEIMKDEVVRIVKYLKDNNNIAKMKVRLMHMNSNNASLNINFILTAIRVYNDLHVIAQIEIGH